MRENNYHKDFLVIVGDVGRHKTLEKGTSTTSTIESNFQPIETHDLLSQALIQQDNHSRGSVLGNGC